MSTVRAAPLPEGALLARYAAQEACYTDCYVIEVPFHADLCPYVGAFYTTPLFRLERVVLDRVYAAPSSDEDARKLAAAETGTFAIWTVEDRKPDQLLMRELSGRTRSWFMVAPAAPEPDATRLYFGSAVLPVRDARTGSLRLGHGYSALKGPHKLYSRALLSSAASRLERPSDPG